MASPHNLPKQEDVSEFDFGNDKTCILSTITDDNRDYMVQVALSVYLGEKCKYCLREYKTLDDLNDTVWAGRHANGRLACQSCWKENNP